MRHTDKFYLYIWKNKINNKLNVGQKISKKETYVSSVESDEFWNSYGAGEMDHYCIFTSSDQELISAAEWWALDYGMNVLGRDSFYNRANNAHRGDQSLLTEEIKQKIVNFYDGKSIPDQMTLPISRGVNIVNRMLNGEYPVEELPVFYIQQNYERKQVRGVSTNQAGVREIVNAYNEDPVEFRKNLTPLLGVLYSTTAKQLWNGNTRLDAAPSCRGLNTLPICNIPVEHFGETEQEQQINLLIAGSYANKRNPVYTLENTEADLIHQMNLYIELMNFDLSVETARDYIRNQVSTAFALSAGSKRAASGVVTKIFNFFDKSHAATKIKQIRTWSDAELKKYLYDTYESKGIAAIHTTMGSLSNMQALGFAFNHTVPMRTKPKKMAIVVHYRYPYEYINEQKNNKLGHLQEIIEEYNLPIVVDVRPAFADE